MVKCAGTQKFGISKPTSNHTMSLAGKNPSQGYQRIVETSEYTNSINGGFNPNYNSNYAPCQ